MKKGFLILASIITLGLISCSNKSKSTENENISYIKEDDKEINIAMDKAKETFNQFEKAFIENQKTNRYTNFVVKEGFPTKDGSKEHMWVSELTYDGNNFFGIVSNEPLYDTQVQFGDTITIDKNLISDWMYTDTSSNLTYGAYTMRVFVDRMSDDKKSAFLMENDFTFAPLSE
ncbi:DUF2314 domain-containing protein [Dysgonomonas sp. HGC4]|uniref:DUF2314 domain-containing protein n=1 Tax=Dysgonomonas sp. HGC4 TaxID=1658009 RepID=UPI000682FFF0|nr:DUF2314 domain-containing protein [Dysgonomonas sp. HGC4]MBD8346376.1 DUF2314 domain-containing protein [Dysgonomonas sp. HGC4]